MSTENSYDTISKHLFEIAREQRIFISFRKGRRSNDVLVMHVEGDGTQVMDFYEAIEKEYPHFALELFNIPDSPNFGLTSALTEPQEVNHPDGSTERRTHIAPLEVFSRPAQEMQELQLGKQGRPPSKQGHGSVSTLVNIATMQHTVTTHTTKDNADTEISDDGIGKTA